MAAARTFMNGPRIYPSRDFGLPPGPAIPLGSAAKLVGWTTPVVPASEILGSENRAYLIFGTGNTAWGIAAGSLMGDLAGGNMTVTVTVTGALTIIQSGLDITVQVAVAGSTPNAIVAAILAAYPAIAGLPCNSFLQGFVPSGTGAGTYNTPVAKQRMIQNQIRQGATT